MPRRAASPQQEDALPPGKLVERLRGREEAAFRALYEAYRARLHTFLLRLTRDEQLARDLGQEAWLRLVANLERLAPDSDPAAWLFTVARNLYLSHRRWRLLDRARLALLSLREPACGVLLPSERAAADQLQSRLERALAELPIRQREVVLLVCIEGFTTKEVGSMLAVDDATVRQRLARARAVLKVALREETS